MMGSGMEVTGRRFAEVLGPLPAVLPLGIAQKTADVPASRVSFPMPP